MAILLNAGGAQSGKAIFVDGSLPREKFFRGELVALTRLIEAEKPSPHGCHHLGLAPNDPSPGVRRRKISNRKRAAIRPNNIFDARSNQIGHSTLYKTQRPNRNHLIALALKIA